MARAEIPRLADHVYLAPTLGPNAVSQQITGLFTYAMRPDDANGRETVFKRIPTRQTAARWTDFIQTVAASLAPRAAWLARRSQFPDPDIFTYERTLLIIPPIPPIENFYTTAVTQISARFPQGPPAIVPRAGISSGRFVRPTPYHAVVGWERGSYDIDLFVIVTERREVLVSPRSSSP